MSDLILSRNCLFRPNPCQEMILFRTCLVRVSSSKQLQIGTCRHVDANWQRERITFHLRERCKEKCRQRKVNFEFMPFDCSQSMAVPPCRKLSTFKSRTLSVPSRNGCTKDDFCIDHSHPDEREAISMECLQHDEVQSLPSTDRLDFSSPWSLLPETSFRCFSRSLS